MEFGNRLVSLDRWEWLKILIVLIIVISPIIGFYIGINTPSSYKIVCVEYKFVRDGKYYIIGKTTSPYRSGTVDVYLVDSNEYDEFLEGFEYSISTTGQNDWHRMYKKVVNFKPMIYD